MDTLRNNISLVTQWPVRLTQKINRHVTKLENKADTWRKDRSRELANIGVRALMKLTPKSI